ncbi:hypothetical protein OG785_45810 [Streptomyces sp. NBC_00006]|uniref:hypothetical protein n=1 Tax=Streptomyces sp. NBC_00006 TaxID=2975619 RepID=UPI0022562827|nr:hypothetical protein [Streptomyces sp. NBC_00006]MCX5537711.1 hypothetical protein [Streptomyces sp. NBC_00006]MCX5537878.1 hypothetical protein [Streptomyces sp. NBC_00006]
MATVCKLYRGDKPLMIPPNTWTLVTYESVLNNDRKMARDLSLISPPSDGDFTWFRNLRWAAIDIPDGDLRPRQFMSRFIRDPHGDRDDTGADDRLATPGRSWQTVSWAFAGQANQPVGVEVWHDHHEAWALEHAQFVGTTSDY